jgi:iron complex transport system ATP-binding protein
MTNGIKVYNLSVGSILKDINLELSEGELLAIVGPNGSGKTTLIKAITGILNNHAHINGNIRINDISLKNYKPIERARCLAYLAQHSELAFDFSVYEIIEMGLYPWRSLIRDKKAYINWILHHFGIASWHNHRFLTLSGGEKQKVHLARVMAQLNIMVPSFHNNTKDGRFLMLDEHTSHLDLYHQHTSFELLLHYIHEYGIGCMAIVHDINLAMKYADSVLLLKSGEIFDYGPTELIMQEKTLETLLNVKLKYIKAYNQFVVT